MSRETGIDIIGAVPWGTHICQFYQSKEDLFEIVIPYIKAGLLNNEYCMWITAEPLTVIEAESALRREVPNISYYLNRKQISVVGYKTVYLSDGMFNTRATLQKMIESEQFAFEFGHAGFRVSGNASFLTEKEWDMFVNYELAVDYTVRRCKVMALCSYPMDGRNPGDIVDVVSEHRLVMLRDDDGWRLVHNNGNGHVINLRNSGKSFREIGRQVGVSGQRIAQLLGTNGTSAPSNHKRKSETEEDNLLTSGEAADLMNIHRNTIRRWADDGTIPSYRVGQRRDRRFRKTDIEKYLGAG